jgi:hypothetical protein
MSPIQKLAVLFLLSLRVVSLAFAQRGARRAIGGLIQDQSGDVVANTR